MITIYTTKFQLFLIISAALSPIAYAGALVCAAGRLGFIHHNRQYQRAKIHLKSLTATPTSTTLNPFVPFTFKSGSTTPHFAPLGLIALVPTGWKKLTAFSLMNALSSSSVSAVSKGSRMYPSHARAEMNRLAERMACRRIWMSTGAARRPGLMSGAAKGAELERETAPPRIEVCQMMECRTLKHGRLTGEGRDVSDRYAQEVALRRTAVQAVLKNKKYV